MFRNLLRWARITDPGADDKNFATQKMEYRGKIAEGLIVFPYGVHGNVPADALALMFAVGGDPENRAAIAWTPNTRPQLAAGEVAFYHPPTMGWVIWRASGDLEIQTGNGGTGNALVTCANATVTASESVTVDTPETTITGNATIDGNLTVGGDFDLAGNADLGAGGQPIARVGDSVAGGVITTGSANHKAT